MTWNLYHGRDRPPDRELMTARSRLFRRTERGATHVQVNRPLDDEFAALIAGAAWDVALLQEAPPRWFRRLCAESRATAASVLTSRNFGAFARRAMARLNPDLTASNEGGSNQTLARAPWRIEAVRRHTLARRPERRRMLWTMLAEPGGRRLAVANVHLSTGGREATRRELREAAECADRWAAGAPLVLGGDLNLRPEQAPEELDDLRRRFGLDHPTGPKAIDHLLARGVRVVEPPRALPDAVRDLPAGGGRSLRLSDHAVVAAAFEVE